MKNKIILLFFLIIFGLSFAQVGVGNANPKVNMDARAAAGNSAIAFGNTNQSATAAGAGAMKYDSTTKLKLGSAHCFGCSSNSYTIDQGVFSISVAGCFVTIFPLIFYH